MKKHLKAFTIGCFLVITLVSVTLIIKQNLIVDASNHTTTYLELPDSRQLNDVVCVNNMIYALTRSDDVHHDSYDQVFRIDSETKEKKVLQIGDSDNRVYHLAVESPQTIWVIGGHNTNDDPSNTNNDYSLINIDADGKHIAKYELKNVLPDGSKSKIKPTGLVIDREGYIYIGTFGGLYVIDSSGTYLFTIKAPVITISSSSNGDVYIVYENNGYHLAKVDKSSRELHNIAEISTYPLGIICDLNLGSAVYYFDNFGLYGLQSDYSSKCLLSWIDCDVNGNLISSMTFVDSAKLLCCISDELAWINFGVPPDDTKQSLELGTIGVNNELAEQIIKFNRSNLIYRISVTDYSKTSGQDNYIDMTSNVLSDISGNSPPDILNLTGLPVEKLTVLGCLDDLYKYLDADSDLSKDDIVQNILKLYEHDNCLYGITPGIILYCLAGKVEDINQIGQLDFDNTLDAIEKGDIIISQSSSSSLLKIACTLLYDDFIYEKDGMFELDDIRFSNILKTIKDLPEISETGITQIPEDTCVLYECILPDFIELQTYKAVLESEVGLKGFGNSNTGVFALSNISLSITSESKNGEAAWSFIRTFLDSKYQIDSLVNNMYFPSNRYALQAFADSCITDEEFKSHSTNKTDVKGYASINGQNIELFDATKHDVELVMNMLYSVDTAYGIDAAVLSIFEEESTKYYKNQISLEDAVKEIKLRTERYLN